MLLATRDLKHAALDPPYFDRRRTVGDIATVTKFTLSIPNTEDHRWSQHTRGKHRFQ
jgi:hypothetical protein